MNSHRTNPLERRSPTYDQLEEEVDTLRRSLVKIVPEPYRTLLDGYRGHRTVADADGWLHDVTDQILEQAISEAAQRPRKPGSFLDGRAYCPLCGAGRPHRYEPGYELPEGLRRHLEGWGSRVPQCVVMRTARNLSLDT